MEQPKVLYQMKQCAGESFRPSNGTEGMMFTEAFCEQCIHERWTHRQDEDREEDKCEIWSNAIMFDEKDDEYPKEWVFNDEGWPVCTNWSKWDWGNDDDGFNEPPEPEPYDPNQLCFPWVMDEIQESESTPAKEPVLNL